MWIYSLISLHISIFYSVHLLFNRYEKLSKIGEGAYGMVFKCLDTQTGDMVAVKRFNASDDDPLVKKIALREIKMLRVG